MTEEWRPCPGVGDRYSVSSLGNVRHDRSGRLRHPTNKHGGYLATAFHFPPTNRMWCPTIAYLVSRAFLGAKPEGMTVNHIDGDKTNNAATNLEYVTMEENVAHKVRLGLQGRGETHGSAKLTDWQVREIRSYPSPLRRGQGRRLCAMYSVERTTIQNIRARKTWKHVV